MIVRGEEGGNEGGEVSRRKPGLLKFPGWDPKNSTPCLVPKGLVFSL